MSFRAACFCAKRFVSYVQHPFDVLTETATSSEYSLFLKTAEPELAHITGLTVVSDLEFVLVFRCDNEMYSDYSNEDPQYIYLPDPYICHIYRALMKRGNDFVFWTSAIRLILGKIKAALPDDLAGVPAVCREDFGEILGVCVDKKISDKKAMQELKNVYAAFSETAYRRGLSLFSPQDYFHDLIEQQQIRFAARNKFPILFADPAHGVFIDDNIDYIKSAVSANWPKERTIHLAPGIFSLRRGCELIDDLCRIFPVPGKS